MPDFTSSTYLGFRHPSRLVEPWESLTTGAPAALKEPAESRRVATELARLQGCEAGILAPSTLHLFWDLFGVLAGQGVSIFHDAGIYPIVGWGITRAAAMGAPVHRFRHYDPACLEWMLRRSPVHRALPVVVADGFCPVCGRMAPLRELVECAGRFGGLVVIDDTQALGVLGHSHCSGTPYGKGGGGTARYTGTTAGNLLIAASLAKGFGVPLTVLSGNRRLVSLYEELSQVRVHCSQPSAAVVHAAGHALRQNAAVGDMLRLRLTRLVSLFRRLLNETGFTTIGGMFPFQTLSLHPGIDVPRLHWSLAARGVATVLHARRGNGAPRISFIITARHSQSDIVTAAAALAEAAGTPIGSYYNSNGGRQCGKPQTASY